MMESDGGEEKKIGLYEEDNVLVLYKNGKRYAAVSNFTVTIIATCINSDGEEIGFVCEVKKHKRGDSWIVSLNESQCSRAYVAYDALNDKGKLYLDLRNAGKYFPKYLNTKLTDFLDISNQPKYYQVEHTGCHIIDGKVYHIMPKKTGGTYIFGENGELVDLKVILKIDGEPQECLKTEGKLMESVIKKIIERTADANKAQIFLSSAWFLQTINNLADSRGFDPLLNVFGKPCSGKTTIICLLLMLFGMERLSKGYSFTELQIQSQKTTCPAVLDDPPPKGTDFINFHNKCAQIAEKRPRCVNKRGQNTVDKISKSSVVIICNFGDFNWAQHHGFLSRANNIELFSLPNTKDDFDNFMVELKAEMDGYTSYSEAVELRWRYLYGDRKHVGDELAAAAKQLLKKIFSQCAPRAIDAYGYTVKYALWLMDYLHFDNDTSDKYKQLLIEYLEKSSRFHREIFCKDLLDYLIPAISVYYEQISGGTIQQAMRKSIVWDKKEKFLFVAYTELEKIYSGFYDEMKEAIENEAPGDCKKWITKHSFLAENADPNVDHNDRSRGNLRANFRSLHSFKIPRESVSKQMINFVREVECGDFNQLANTSVDPEGDNDDDQIAANAALTLDDQQPSTSKAANLSPVMTRRARRQARIGSDVTKSSKRMRSKSRKRKEKSNSTAD